MIPWTTIDLKSWSKDQQKQGDRTYDYPRTCMININIILQVNKVLNLKQVISQSFADT